MDAPISTDRLLLRPFRADDLDALHALWADPEVAPWIGGGPETVGGSAEQLGRQLQHQLRHGFSLWAVEERETGAFVGEVGLMLFENRGPEVEIGWCTVPDRWGRGYAQEAAERWLRVGFEDLRLDRIIAVVLPDNTRSRAVCARLGMRHTGSRHAYGAEHALYELGAEEFRHA